MNEERLPTNVMAGTVRSLTYSAKLSKESGKEDRGSSQQETSSLPLEAFNRSALLFLLWTRRTEENSHYAMNKILT